MDILAELLRESGLRRRVLNQRGLPTGGALSFPCTRSIGFHVVTSGEAWLHRPGDRAPLHLRRGDVALMARGCEHVLSAEPKYDSGSVRPLHEAPAPRGAARATVVSGAYQFWHEPVHPFFGELPDWFVLRAEEQSGLERLPLAVSLLGEETARPDLGSEAVIHGLLDVLFTYLVRAIVARQGERPRSWGRAMRDDSLRRAIELMHERPERDWTLVELAKKAGLSRASFAEKFRAATGQTPLRYLTSIRMQRAMRLLSETAEPLETVAGAVGYADAFSFSKVFKRTLGLSPREFRARDRDERNAAWRF